MNFNTGHGDFAETLQQVKVSVLDNDICGQDDWYGDRITNNQICAGYKQGGRDSCQVTIF